MNLNDLIREEENGIIFCKIGKNSLEMWGKGGHFPYRDYIGKTINLKEGSITFERLDDVVKYLHYGDDLVIFSFSEGRDELPDDGYLDNQMNKGCYNTRTIYVRDVLSFKEASTVDFIYDNMTDRSEFYGYCYIASEHLKDRKLYEAAQRWLELAQKDNVDCN